MSDNITEEQIWEVIHAWFSCRGMATPQIESYNHFITKTMKDVVESCNPVSVETNDDGVFVHRLRFSNPRVERNTNRKPNDCRLQSASYLAQMYITISYSYEEYVAVGNTLELHGTIAYRDKEIRLCMIPIMVNSCLCYLHDPSATSLQDLKTHRIMSDECPYDQGGYFIIRGSEKTLIAQEANRANKVIVSPGLNTNDICRADILSSNVEKSLFGKVSVIYSRYNPWDPADKSCQLLVRIPGISEDLPLFVVLIALWHTAAASPEQLIRLVVPDGKDAELIALVMPSFHLFQASGKDARMSALLYLASRYTLNITSANNDTTEERLAKLSNNLCTRVLPHMGVEPENSLAKCFFIGGMAGHCLQVVCGRRSYDDRDHWGSKRLQLSGSLLLDIFRFNFDNFLKAVGKSLGQGKLRLAHGSIDHASASSQALEYAFVPKASDAPARNLSDARAIITTIQDIAYKAITKAITTALATGNWRTNNNVEGQKSGISQNMVRLSYASTLSQIRRSSSGIDESSKAITPRLLHTTQFGYFCPCETPEGAKVGLIKNFSLMASITLGVDRQENVLIEAAIRDMYVTDAGADAGADADAGVGAGVGAGVARNVFIQFPTAAQPSCGALRLADCAKVLLNGRWLGFVLEQHVALVVSRLKTMRTAGIISRYVSVSYAKLDRELVISTDEGRVARPLFTVQSTVDPVHKLVVDCALNIRPRDVQASLAVPDSQRWQHLVGAVGESQHFLEFLDPNEEEASIIAMDRRHLLDNQQRARTLGALLAAERGAPLLSSPSSQPQPQLQPSGGTAAGSPALQRILDARMPLPLAYTHMELHPALILSAIASLIPYPDHNQSPRNLYQSSMGKQSVGIYALNWLKRFDTSSINVLHYIQRPLLCTKAMNYVNFKSLPAGANLIVAIMVYSGFNQEDSLIMSQSAVDRGLMRCSNYHTYDDTAENDATSLADADKHQKFCVPSKMAQILGSVLDLKDIDRDKTYLEADGLPAVGGLSNSSIVIGKITPKKESRGETSSNIYLDTSTLIKMGEAGFIDAVMLTIDQSNDYNAQHGSSESLGARPGARSGGFGGEYGGMRTQGLSRAGTSQTGALLAKVRVRSNRPPQIGDKFSSRHGQKGTVGMLYRHEDLPLTVSDGITPDIIMNPHAIPSRMTIGQVFECVGSKLGCLLGSEIDGTPFCDVSINSCLDCSLVSSGLEESTDIYKFGNFSSSAHASDALAAQRYADSGDASSEGSLTDKVLTSNLHKMGYQRHSNEAMLNGMTGQLLTNRVFIGPVFYQRLKHMILDKISARGTGVHVNFTRQPNEGRSNFGGMRIGEMERDTFISHGASAVLRDRLMFCSDVSEFVVCRGCGLLCWHADAANITESKPPSCPICEGKTGDTGGKGFAIIQMPYAGKLFFQELMGMGIFPRINVDID